jgi:hypothetical protein
MFKKLRDIIFFLWDNNFMSHFEGHFEGAKTFLTPFIVPSAARDNERGKQSTDKGKQYRVLTKINSVTSGQAGGIFRQLFLQCVDSSSGRVPACHAGGLGSIPGRCSSIVGIWREAYIMEKSIHYGEKYTLCPSTLSQA